MLNTNTAAGIIHEVGIAYQRAHAEHLQEPREKYITLEAEAARKCFNQAYDAWTRIGGK
jgi:hypothetical protein